MLRNVEENQKNLVIIASQWLDMIKSTAIKDEIRNILFLLNVKLAADRANTAYKIMGINRFLEYKLPELFKNNPASKAEITIALITNLFGIDFGPKALAKANIYSDNYQTVIANHIDSYLLTDETLASSLIKVGKQILNKINSTEVNENDKKLALLDTLRNTISKYTKSNKNHIKQEFIDRLQQIRAKLADPQYSRFDDELDRAVSLLKYRENDYYEGRLFGSYRKEGSSLRHLIVELNNKIARERAGNNAVVDIAPRAGDIPPRKNRP